MLTLLKRLVALPKMLKDPQVKLYKKIMVIVGLAYLISPMDLIPDPILGLGVVDDAALITYIISTIKEELDKHVVSRKKDPINKDKIVDHVDYKIDDE